MIGIVSVYWVLSSGFGSIKSLARGYQPQALRHVGTRLRIEGQERCIAGVTKRVERFSFELTYTAWDLEPFAKDCGYNGPPFRWDDDRRFLLRCELDAAYFILYGIARDDVDYIMGTFRVWKEKEEKQLGEYRTKRVILEIYDELQKAIESGEPYQTRLDPPPADAAVAHAARGEVEV